MDFKTPLLVALIPLILGMIYYNENVMGKAWMATSGVKMPETKPSLGQMMKIFIPVYIFSFFFAMLLMNLCIHQMGAYGMIGGEPSATTDPSFQNFLNVFGDAFRTFKHGALHGGIAGLFLTLFFVGIPALFEQKSWKYIFIHVGFNVLCGILMGGLLCQFAFKW